MPAAFAAAIAQTPVEFGVTDTATIRLRARRHSCRRRVNKHNCRDRDYRQCEYFLHFNFLLFRISNASIKENIFRPLDAWGEEIVFTGSELLCVC